MMNVPRTRWLVVSMAVAVMIIAALAYWDQQRESALALEDFADAQSTLASVVGAALAGRLEAVRHDAFTIAHEGAPAIEHTYLATSVRADTDPPLKPPSDRSAVLLSVPLGHGKAIDLATPTANLLAPFWLIERTGERIVLLLPPRASQFLAGAGRQVEAAELRAALDAGRTTVRLERPQAAKLGLSLRTAMAGLVRVDDPLLGSWGVAVVTTAGRDRDRERRAVWRLLLSTLLAAGLVLAFGGLALRERGREFEASRSLAVELLAHEREQRLERESRAATMITLASGMAHEIYTPLGVIVGRAEQLQARVNGDERSAKAAQAIVDQADHIREVIRGFLSIARGTPPALSSVPPRIVIDAALALVEHRFTRAGVQMVASVPEGLPLIRCEPRLLGHALVNLLLNACDACPPGGRVTVSAERSETGVEFVVADDGAGISDKVAARATEPFFTTKSGAGGTGLGLAIANEIVKTHRGELTVARNDERGTRVSIRIPLAREDNAHA